jgi:hypothetical protein
MTSKSSLGERSDSDTGKAEARSIVRPLQTKLGLCVSLVGADWSADIDCNEYLFGSSLIAGIHRLAYLDCNPQFSRARLNSRTTEYPFKKFAEAGAVY